MEIKVGDLISFGENNDIGMVCDYKNLNPLPAQPIEDKYFSFGFALVLFDGNVRKHGCYRPYWLVNLSECKLVKSALKPEVGDLKSQNTQLGRTNCFACGGLLKNPMGNNPRFQYCPKCEP